jgi:hypothetical protein
MQKLNTSPDISEQNESSMQDKSQCSSDSNQISDYSFSYSVMGALVLFKDKPNLAQMAAIRVFFNDLTDQIIEEKINGLLSTK